MASSQFVLFLGIVLATEIAVASGCTTELQECLSESAGYANIKDVAKMCEVLIEANKCLKGVQGNCDNDALKSTIDQSIKGFEMAINAQCSTITGGGDGDSSTGSGGSADCTEAGYDSCLEGASKEKPCPAYKCVQNLKDTCVNKGFKDFYDGHKKLYDMAKEKCGCGNLQPSILALLVTALLMVVKSYF